MNPPVEDAHDGSLPPPTAASLHRPPNAFSAGRGSESVSSLSSSDQQLPATENATLKSSLNGSILADRSQQRTPSPATRSFRDSTFEDPVRNTIIRSFAPRVAVYASSDTEHFLAGKGFSGGLTELLKPFAEQIRGKVVVRDSHGVSKAWDDFGIRVYDARSQAKSSINLDSIEEEEGRRRTNREQSPPSKTLSIVDSVLKRSLEIERLSQEDTDSDSTKVRFSPALLDGSQVFSDYLHLLLSGASMVPYETFSHPVAAIIVVTSHSESPIETLRQLYALSGPSNPLNPAWLGSEYLRYYILIHDEDRSEVARSTALFDLMKRHFGLHCHLLRLRSSECIASDDDSVILRPCEWQSPKEILSNKYRKDDFEDLERNDKFVFESDASAINVLLREMVTQSIIPFMENRVMTWNDQVASRRRGLGGRFMSLSKRWAGFGSSKASGANNAASNSSNFNTSGQFYPPETPEAVLRQLADYAMMLRDWRLAYSTYDLMRSDFSHDKAWAYHAAASEMAAVTATLLPQHSNFRPDMIDQLVDAAVYSYLTRCSLPDKAKRCLILVTELLLHRSTSLADQSARWASRALELAILGPTEQDLVAERIGAYYSSSSRSASKGHSSKARHAAAWSVIATSAWITSDRLWEGGNRLRTAAVLYNLENPKADLPFQSMQPLWKSLSTSVKSASLLLGQSTGLNQTSIDTDVEKEQLDVFIADQKSSLNENQDVGFTAPPLPVAAGHQVDISSGANDDGFE